MKTSETIQRICSELTVGNLEAARSILRSEIPFNANAKLSHMLKSSSLRPSRPSSGATFPKSRGTRLSNIGKTQLYLRDGFIDRYEGTRLIFPGVLRLLSHLMPLDFPYHSHWKMSACHSLYWNLQPTLDHMVPSPRGGADTPENMVCTSM